VEELVEALGACPHLRHLAVDFKEGEGDDLRRALEEAVRDGVLPCLRELSISDVEERAKAALARHRAVVGSRREEQHRVS
jgi:hypothetical protein